MVTECGTITTMLVEDGEITEKTEDFEELAASFWNQRVVAIDNTTE